jgi:hypothetical protein
VLLIRRTDNGQMDRSMRLRIAHYLEGRTAASPHLG